MADGEKGELSEREEVIQVRSEVHSLTKAFYSFVEEFKAYRAKSEPKPIGVAGSLAIATSILAIFAILFGSVIYITNSSNAPIAATLSQTTSILQGMNNNIQQNTSFIQLTNKEILGIKNMAHGNEDTLRWIIFEENLPKQITVLQEQYKNMREHSHIHKSMSLDNQ